MPRTLPSALLLLGLAAACGGGARYSVGRVSVARTEPQRAAGFLEEAYLGRLDRHPRLADELGAPGIRDDWADPSSAVALESAALLRRELERASSEFAIRRLDDDLALDLRVLELADRVTLDRLDWRQLEPLASGSHGAHRELLEHLLLVAVVDDLASAEAYVTRIAGLGARMEWMAGELIERAAQGFAPPRAMARAVHADVHRWYLTPGEARRPLLARVEALRDVPVHERERLIAATRTALDGALREGAVALVAALEEVDDQGPEDGALWRLAGGRAAYQAALRRITTTERTPEQQRALGEAEVARLHEDLSRLTARVGFAGTVPQFLTYLREHPGLAMPAGDEGRKAWRNAVEPAARDHGLTLRELPELLAPQPPRLVGPTLQRPPRATLVVDLTRPELLGLHRVDAFVARQIVARYQAAELPPPGARSRVRRTLGWPAWEEGWALYGLARAREAGAFRDPWFEVGAVSEELRSAALLVADTSLHAGLWSAEDAEAYLRENTAEPLEVCERLVADLQARPGRACAATVGLDYLRRLRQRVASRTGAGFDRDAFHVALAQVGPVPLELLEDAVLDRLDR